jgi:hypothetical protein
MLLNEKRFKSSHKFSLKRMKDSKRKHAFIQNNNNKIFKKK